MESENVVIITQIKDELNKIKEPIRKDVLRKDGIKTRNLLYNHLLISFYMKFM